MEHLGVLCLRGHRSAKSHPVSANVIPRVALMLGPSSKLFSDVDVIQLSSTAEDGRQGQSIKPRGEKKQLTRTRGAIKAASQLVYRGTNSPLKLSAQFAAI